jgi:hypothetical protein
MRGCRLCAAELDDGYNGWSETSIKSVRSGGAYSYRKCRPQMHRGRTARNNRSKATARELGPVFSLMQPFPTSFRRSSSKARRLAACESFF